MPTYTQIAGTVLAMTLTSDQTLFMLYHYNSYANNPILLRSPKPMVMRDIFLTRSYKTYPNPLSSLYVSDLRDCVCNSVVSWLVVKPLSESIGWRHCVVIYLCAGLFSSFAYLFGGQMNPKKLNSPYDCACTSNGAFAGLAAISFMVPKCYIPYSKNTHVAYVSAAYLTYCAYEEYIRPFYVDKRRRGDIELRNWGFVGGVFSALIYGSLLLRTKTDMRLMTRFYSNIKKTH